MNAGVVHVKVTPDPDSSNAHSGSDFLARWESSGRRTWYIYSFARIGGICRPDRLQNKQMSQDHAMTHEQSKVICESRARAWNSSKEWMIITPVVADYPINCLWNKFEEKIKVHLFWLFAIGVKAVFQLHYVHMSELLHDLHNFIISLYDRCSTGLHMYMSISMWIRILHLQLTILEALILKHFLDSHHLSSVHHRRLLTIEQK